MKFGLFIKYHGLSKDSMVFSTDKPSLKEAKQYFLNLKKLNEVEFNKLFIVAEIKDEIK
tara:strand:+ start:1015 stop:1191 length:177 start_codon:yes stop_codon:yes gene_type:complete